MFTQHLPRTGSPVGNHLITRVGAASGALALGVGIALVPMSAHAETATASYAEGQFLSGTIAGVDLNTVVSLDGAVAVNDGTQPKQISDDPLSASALQTVDVEQEGGIQTDPPVESVDAGTLNQYAEANNSGVSIAASGAIGDDGALGSGPVSSGAAGDVDVDLDATMDDEYADILHNLSLSLDAIAARAEGNLDTASGDYRIEGAVLTFTSPAIGDLTAKVNAALDSVNADLAALAGPDGALRAAVDEVLDPVLGIVGSSADVTIDIDEDVHEAVQSLLTGVYADGAVRFNLQTGSVSIDLEALFGGNLNDLPADTELLSDEVIVPVLESIADTVESLADQIVDRVEESLHDATVNVHADMDLLSEQGTTDNQVCHDVQVPIIGDILGGILGVTTQGIIGYATETVCEIVETALPAQRSTAQLDISGTVDQLVNGSAAQSSASVSLLDDTANAAINVDQVVDGLGEGLLEGMFGSNGAVSGFEKRLNLALVDPAVEGLLGDTSVDSALTDVLSLRANVQETDSAGGDSTFTQTALRLASFGDELTTLSLGEATVGPNITRVVDTGCTVDCSPGQVLSGSGTQTSISAAASGAQALAYTGMGIANLLGAVLALLAAGAFMTRESYRKNHPQVTRVRTEG